MQRTLYLLVLLAAPLLAQGNPVYEVTADHANGCRPDGCKQFKKGYRFEATNWGENDPEIGGSNLAGVDAQTERKTYVFQGKDVAPVLDARGNHVEPNCTWPTGGVMQHAVTDAQGRVYIKRVEVTTKCVNGKMTTIQRALN